MLSGNFYSGNHLSNLFLSNTYKFSRPLKLFLKNTTELKTHVIKPMDPQHPRLVS